MSKRDMTTKGNLPHWYMPGTAHFVTYRLADTLPIDVLLQLRANREAELRRPPRKGESQWAQKARANKQFFGAYDRYLDQSSEFQWLKLSEIAKIVVDSLYFLHQERYQLLEYTVMPNHVHTLFVPMDSPSECVSPIAESSIVRVPDLEPDETGCEYFSDEISDSRSPLSKIMHSLKSFTANEANKFLGRTGKFWQRESYDHWVRGHAELTRIAEYISNNAVSANLVQNAWDWPFCSSYDRRHPRDKTLAVWW